MNLKSILATGTAALALSVGIANARPNVQHEYMMQKVVIGDDAASVVYIEQSGLDGRMLYPDRASCRKNEPLSPLPPCLRGVLTGQCAPGEQVGFYCAPFDVGSDPGQR